MTPPARRTPSSASKNFLEEHGNTLVALQILYARSHATRRFDRAAIEELRDAMRRPPWLLEPIDIGRAYKRLEDDRVKGNPARALSDIVMLVRYALGELTTLEPLPATIAGRFNLWLGREERVAAPIPEASAPGSSRSATSSRSTSTSRPRT
jgi:type I restriction enzyme, R subunit